VAPHDPTSTCAQCASFSDELSEIERILAGLTALSSAYGSTRDRDGVCALTERFQDSQPACREFMPRRGAGAAAGTGR